MTQKYYLTKDFKKLQDDWSKKLKESGFKDIEYNDNLLVGGSASNKLNHNFSLERYQNRETYYRLAGQFLHFYKFEDAEEKEIWRLHSEGVSYREIPKKLNISYSKDTIHKKIKKLAKLMLAEHKKEMENDQE